MVTPEYIKVECYIWGLMEDIQGKVTSSKSTKIQEAIRIAHDLMDRVVRAKVAKDIDKKRKWEDEQGGNPYQQQNKRQKWLEYTLLDQVTEKDMLEPYHSTTSANFITTTVPSPFNVETERWWTPTSLTCYECREKGHIRKYYPALEIRNKLEKLAMTRNNRYGYVPPQKNRYVSV
ncbi:hypothetical protein Tco_0522374 [Tanacetum coccineum]